MMTSKECAETWKEVLRIYKEDRDSDNRPDTCMKKIIASIGKEKAMEVFATVAAIKKHDGRIYGKNRETMNAVEINPDSVKWEYGTSNPMIYAGLDDIHTAHINQLITELIKEVGE